MRRIRTELDAVPPLRGAAVLRRSALGVMVASLTLGLGIGCAAAATFAARVGDATSTISSATMLLSGTTPLGGTCVSTGSTITTNAASCAGSPYPAGPLSAATSSSSTSTFSSLGNFSPTSAKSSQACGVAELADTSSAATNTALPYFGLTYGAAGPMGQSSVALDGTTGFAQTLTSFANPEGFTLLAWFKTTASGTVAGFSNAQYASATATNDRTMWVDSTGHLVWSFGTVSATHEVKSSVTVTTGSWVFAAATIGPGGATLYVNGALVGSSAVTAARSYTGWWHLGWGAESNWSDAPTSQFLAGSLAQVAVVPSQLSAAQVTSLNTASSSGAAAYDAAVTALAPTSWWQLSDTGATAYTGVVPATGTAPCTAVMATIQVTRGVTTTCVYPVVAGACPAPSAGSLLSSMPVSSMTPPTGGSPLTSIVTFRLSTASVTGVAGLHLLPALTVTTTVTGTLWTASLSYATASAEL